MATILHLEGLNLPMILPRFKPAYSVGQIREGHKPYHLRQYRKVGHRPQKTCLMIARCLVGCCYIIRRAMGQGLYPRVCQKSLDIDVTFGLHKQLIENIV